MKPLLIVFLALFTFSSVAQNTYKLPEFEKFQLPNGLTIYLMEQHEMPLISVSAVFDAGSILDGNRQGIASLTSDALLFGTKKYSKSQIEEITDYLGATLSANADKDVAGISASFAAKDQDKLFDIIGQVLMFPVFDPIEFGKHKQRVIQELIQQKTMPQTVIGKYFNSFVFDKFPYASPASGTGLTVGKISQADVKAFYQSNYTTGHGAIAVVGDFKTADMKKKMTDLFGGWKTGQSRMIKRVAPDLDFKQSRVLLINKEDARETTFLIGGKGIDYNSPDYIPVLVINTILGGRFTSWLNDALRINSGLTYGAFSHFARYQYAGTFSISTFTKTSTTIPAIDMALQVLDSLHKTGINEATLSSAKAYVKGEFPPNYESAGALAGLLSDMFVHHYDEEFINTFQQKVDAMTVEQAKNIINQYFPKDNLQFILIGKADTIREQVRKYGTVTERQMKSDGF